MSTLEVQGPLITVAAKSPHVNLPCVPSSKTYRLHEYPIPYIMTFKALCNLSFKYFSDDISTIPPSLTLL